MSSFELCGRQFTCQELEKLALVYDFDIENQKTSFLVPLHTFLPVKRVWWREWEMELEASVAALPSW